RQDPAHPRLERAARAGGAGSPASAWATPAEALPRRQPDRIPSRGGSPLPGSLRRDDLRSLHVQRLVAVLGREHPRRRDLLGEERGERLSNVDLTVPARVVLFDEQDRQLSVLVDDSGGLAVAQAIAPARDVLLASLAELQVARHFDELTGDRRDLRPVQNGFLLGSPGGVHGRVGPLGVLLRAEHGRWRAGGRL